MALKVNLTVIKNILPQVSMKMIYPTLRAKMTMPLIKTEHSNTIFKKRLAANCNKNISLRYKYNDSLKCWKCGFQFDSKDVLFCQKCDTVQKPRSTYNYFQLLNITENFNLETEDLAKRFKYLQSCLHPDKFANRTEEEKTISAEYSSIINLAYSTLKNPLKRGLHLLSLKGHSIADGTIDDPELLEEIMEKNEMISQNLSLEQLKKEHDNIIKSLETIELEIKNSFNSQHLESAKKLLYKMRYFTNLENQLKERINEKSLSV